MTMTNVGTDPIRTKMSRIRNTMDRTVQGHSCERNSSPKTFKQAGTHQHVN